MAIPNRSPLKISGENEACAYPVAVQIFGVPLLSQERVKLRTSNLASTFTGPIRIKIRKKIYREKGAWVYLGAAQIFGGTPYFPRNG